MANIINGTDTGSGGLITTGDSSDELQIQTAEVARVTLTNTAVVVNESGADVDFRVEGDTDANLLFVDASADAIGIGTNAPVIGGARDYSRVLTIDGGTNTGIEDTGALELGSSTDTNDRIVGSLAFFNRDNSGSTGETRRQVALIEAKCATSDSNAGNDSGGNLVFLTKTEASFVTERMRLTSDAASFLRMASGTGGIQFNGDTAAANALDDYEEGTWTPVFEGTVNPSGLSLGNTDATYTKIGNSVRLSLNVTVSNIGTGGSGGMKVTGLPFTASSAMDFQPCTTESEGLLASVSNFVPIIEGNTTSILLYAGWNGTGGPTQLAWGTNAKNGMIFRVYHAA
jgi:hypothetical protein